MHVGLQTLCTHRTAHQKFAAADDVVSLSFVRSQSVRADQRVHVCGVRSVGGAPVKTGSSAIKAEVIVTRDV